ncbi:MAG TPA: 2-dehydropantoate 2-reductase [Crinalium sp.]|jgi:2-dehydropantoate 2-reductase
MSQQETIYILGSGAVGFSLAVYLVNAGKNVVAVRTSRNDVPKSTIAVTVHNDETFIRAAVETISLSNLARLDGTIVITSKSYANKAIALALKDKAATGPIVIMQNGVGVETPFLDAQFSSIYRCVLYVTSQATSEYDFVTRPVTASPIGIISGNETELQTCVEQLTTREFPFRSEANIQREIWKKAIINAVFNSICPLLNVDNGIFIRSEEAADLARDIVQECVMLTDRLNLELSERELIEQMMLISKRSDGQLISTLQDIRMGRPTEIESLNLEISRVAASMYPELHLPKVELLGKMIVAKSLQQSSKGF